MSKIDNTDFPQGINFISFSDDFNDAVKDIMNGKNISGRGTP